MMLTCGATTHGEQKSAPAKQLQFNLRLLEGDPLGSVEAGTVDILSQPQLITQEKQECSMFTGQEILAPAGAERVECGVKVRIQPGAIVGGKVRLDITASHSTLESQSKDRIEIRTDETRAITTVRLGEVVKLRMDKGDAKRQKWVEVSVVAVAEAKP
jgi:hypothetical protein